MAKKVIVTQAIGQPEVTTDILAQSIKAVADGMKALRRGRLNDKAFILLVHAATKPTHPSRPKVSQAEVRSVIAALESLEAEYLRK